MTSCAAPLWFIVHTAPSAQGLRVWTELNWKLCAAAISVKNWKSWFIYFSINDGEHALKNALIYIERHICILEYISQHIDLFDTFSFQWLNVEVKAGQRAVQGAEGALTLTPLYLDSIFTRSLSGSAQTVSYWSELSVFCPYISPPLCHSSFRGIIL